MDPSASTVIPQVGETGSQTDIVVGRQAIYDRDRRVFAYELLYRDRQGGVGQGVTGEQATARVMLNSFLELGAERMVGDHRAFINFTDDLLLSLPAIPFEPNRLVLEILEDAEVNERLLQAVAKLSAGGYIIALDDYKLEPKWNPLLPHVDILKFDVPSVTAVDVRRKLMPLRKTGVRLLAEKIETEAQYRLYLELGFDLFQGYFFSRPNAIKGQRLSENQLVVMQLLSRINDPGVDIDELSLLIARDASLSFKILRYINSAALNLPREVDSINQAVVYLGLARIRGLATLMSLTGITDKPMDLLISALVRGHLCEYLAMSDATADASSGFTVGLLSILDSLLDMAMPDVLSQLPLSQKLEDALLHHKGSEGEALRCALAYEQHRWDEVTYGDLRTEEICKYYLHSTELAFRAGTVMSSPSDVQF